MIDTTFERASALFTNEGYFGRYRELLANMSCRAAWEKVESELPFNFRRFSTYDSFKKALRQERKSALPLTVRLTADATNFKPGIYCDNCGKKYSRCYPPGITTVYCQCGHEFDIYTPPA